MPDTNIDKPEHTKQDFAIVGIGASAGELDAFKKFLENLTPDSGMAYVFVQHLSPDHDSSLPKLLASQTKVPVHEIIDDINLAPDNIYIIPENKIVTTYDGVLKLSDRDPDAKPNMPVDIFFSSLAEVHKSYAIGIVLTGNGDDGSEGIKAIKENGGITFVQNPDTASFKNMPFNAIRAGAADFILNIEEMPQALLDVQQVYGVSRAFPDEDGPLPKSEEEVFRQILKLLLKRTGNDFSHYKQPTIRRRIARRMVICKKSMPVDYYSFLRNNKDEQDALFNDILIPVSYFFRDGQIFETIRENVFERIKKQQNEDEAIRLWVAGCSSGEEAYSIAIVLHEFLQEENIDSKVQIFASDISEVIISRARSAVYTPQEVKNVSKSRLDNYFTKTDGAYYINKVIRDMCVFAVHNFVKDPPFARMDFISCRNVLIYLDPYLQKKALTTFHYALKPHGMLFLGKSETASQVPNLFEPVVRGQKIYAKKLVSGYVAPSFERTDNNQPERNNPSRRKNTTETDFQKVASEILFSKYTPAGVIINENKDIVHFHGDTSPFLLPPQGKPNFNIFKMLRDGLAFEMRNALVIVKNTGDKVVRDSITLKGADYLVNLEILLLPGNIDTHYLILFTTAATAIDDKTQARERKSADARRIKQLEAEIEQMREDIRRVTEDQEVANEELQSANEELLSNGEELQTLNEELETSAEELQSNNEELITVNDELMDRQEQLSHAREYSDAIVETVREPLLILDGNIKIRSANASFYKYFSVTESEISGRSLFDISAGRWNIPELKTQLESVLKFRNKLENFEIKSIFPVIGERVMLLNARPIINDRASEQFMLIAIDDITFIRDTNSHLLRSNRELEENNKELASFTYIASHDLQEPIRKIHTFSQLIIDNEKGRLSELSLKYLSRMIVSTERMQRLIDDLLNYSRINNQDNSFETVDLTLIAEEAKQDLLESYSDKVEAQITIMPLPLVKVIPGLMSQVFLNLIGNAIKYSRPEIDTVIKIETGKISNVGLALPAADEDTVYNKITISDNGIGFPQELSQSIFEPFQRLHGKDKYEGTGIGLAICRKIISRHKGFIQADSSPGKGSVFSIFLPANL